MLTEQARCHLPGARNSISVQRYPQDSLGITPHRDESHYLNLISIFVLAGEARITELAERAYSSKQAIGYLVEYLEDHGYVERIPDPNDGRAQIVRRTERGWQVNRTAWRLVQQIQTEWAQQLGEKQMGSMIESLRMLVQLLGVPYEMRIVAEQRVAVDRLWSARARQLAAFILENVPARCCGRKSTSAS